MNSARCVIDKGDLAFAFAAIGGAIIREGLVLGRRPREGPRGNATTVVVSIVRQRPPASSAPSVEVSCTRNAEIYSLVEYIASLLSKTPDQPPAATGPSRHTTQENCEGWGMRANYALGWS